jgi:hypothetical protein
VFDRYRGTDPVLRRKELRHDFVFHMTDWIDDLHELKSLYDNPQAYTREQAASIVYRFFMHALSHLKAGERILFDPEERCDPFADQYADATPAS